MENHDELVRNPERRDDRYCFVRPGGNYEVYLPTGATGSLDLIETRGEFLVTTKNPQTGNVLHTFAPEFITGGKTMDL